jgi:hypothetical protein
MSAIPPGQGATVPLAPLRQLTALSSLLTADKRDRILRFVTISGRGTVGCGPGCEGAVAQRAGRVLPVVWGGCGWQNRADGLAAAGCDAPAAARRNAIRMTPAGV